MIEHETKIRVRYGETDQMGYMYYGNYAEWYEVGRVEMLRSLGMTYRSMEQSGVIMPVLELKCKYLKPALYDEEIRLRVILREKPAVRIKFDYELFNERGELINTGETTLVFLDAAKKRPRLPPEEFLERIGSYFPGDR